jgi:hypothetical protein
MEKVIPSFQYEPLVFSKTKNFIWEEDKGNTNGARPSNTRIEEEEPRDFRGGKDSLQREASGMTYALKQTLEPIEFILHKVNS